DAKKQIEISFSQKGTYTINKMEVICQPMNEFGSQVERLKEFVLENVEVGVNQITGTIKTDKEKILCLSIPYSKGWRAYNNGSEVEMLNVNTMYSGIILPAGEHSLELKYTTPYMKQGGVLSITGLLLFAAVIVWREKLGTVIMKKEKK
ncbi:MAG: YfhO family protein, partial [Oscillospiraceae bacterium]|nr:YfhO family protein [Oscillospiraceae bacterium]